MPPCSRRATRLIALLPIASAIGGCPESARTEAQPRTLSYHEDVAPILLSSCASCHRTGGIAPFPLLTYDDAVQHRMAIKTATAQRSMPPFNLDNSGTCNTYVEARWLDDAAIATIGTWVDSGAPEGDARKAPPPVPPPPGLDRVDLTLGMVTPYTPDPSKDDDYRCFVIDPGLERDQFITGFEIRPGEPRMVHHLTLFAFDSLEAEKAAERLDAAQPGAGYECFGDTIVPSRWLVGSGPGGGAIALPEGTGLRMSAGRKTVLQMHYNRLNGLFADRTAIDLKLAASVLHEAVVPRLAATSLDLPPRREAVSETETLRLPEPVTLWGVWPHMHTLGSSLRVTASHRGTEQCVAQVNRWDFHWQGFANYTTPIRLSAGDTMRITCTYDTMTRDTPTGWGQGTVDEMCIAFFYITQGQ